MQLRPTTPLRPRGLIDRAVSLLESDRQADCVRAVTTPKQTPYKMWQPSADGYMKKLLETDLPEPYNLPRQKLPMVLWQTGHVDVIRTRTILEQRSLTGRRVRPIMVDPPYCIDIDSVEDLEAAGRALACGHARYRHSGRASAVFRTLSSYQPSSISWFSISTEYLPTIACSSVRMEKSR